MTAISPDTAERIRAPIEICKLEADYLQRCDARLFVSPLASEAIRTLRENDELAERVDAFVARFGRLQDSIGDKLLPAFLKLMQEAPGAMLENLDRAERLGLLESADTWVAVRKLRNRMIHEYVKDPGELADALNAAHEHIPLLAGTLQAIAERIAQRFPELVAH